MVRSTSRRAQQASPRRSKRSRTRHGPRATAPLLAKMLRGSCSPEVVEILWSVHFFLAYSGRRSRTSGTPSTRPARMLPPTNAARTRLARMGWGLCRPTGGPSPPPLRFLRYASSRAARMTPSLQVGNYAVDRGRAPRRRDGNKRMLTPGQTRRQQSCPTCRPKRCQLVAPFGRIESTRCVANRRTGERKSKGERVHQRASWRGGGLRASDAESSPEHVRLLDSTTGGHECLAKLVIPVSSFA